MYVHKNLSTDADSSVFTVTQKYKQPSRLSIAEKQNVAHCPAEYYSAMKQREMLQCGEAEKAPCWVKNSHTPADKTFDLFPLCGTVNNAAVITCVLDFVWTHIFLFLGWTPRSGLARAYGNCLNVWRTARPFSKRAVTVSLPTSGVGGFPFVQSLERLVLSVPWNPAIVLARWEVVSHCGCDFFFFLHCGFDLPFPDGWWSWGSFPILGSCS